VIGLVPWAGDLLTAVIGVAILAAAHQARVPVIVQTRMLFNLAIDLAIGLVPFAGDVVDMFWKANTKNFAMLERHAAAPLTDTTGDWWFVTGIVAAIVGVAALPVLMVYWLFNGVPGPGFKWW
jgi:hypothetical protein